MPKQTRSRPQIDVATSNRSHSATTSPFFFFFLGRNPARSRLQFLVATSSPAEPGPTPPNQVATPFSGHDLKLPLKASNPVATSKFQVATLSRLVHAATSNCPPQVATWIFMSRPRTSYSYPQLGHDTKKDVATPTPPI